MKQRASQSSPSGRSLDDTREAPTARALTSALREERASRQASARRSHGTRSDGSAGDGTRFCFRVKASVALVRQLGVLSVAAIVGRDVVAAAALDSHPASPSEWSSARTPSHLISNPHPPP